MVQQRFSNLSTFHGGGNIPTRPRLHRRPPPPPPPPPPPHRRRTVHFDDDDDDDSDNDVVRQNVANNNDDNEEEEEEDDVEEEEDDVEEEEEEEDDVEEEEEEEDDVAEEEEEEEVVPEDAKPIGEEIRVSGKGRGFKKHFNGFQFDSHRFHLEDPVLLTPEDKTQKPYVAIIKDITQSRDGSMMITGQWFYRPEEAEKSKGGSWQARDTRELFYSFHRDDVPAESVMHKCVVHFVPLNKQIPSRKQFPGFIIQRVYDTVEKKLWKLTDKDYEDGKQEEIDVMVKKTISRLGELPDIETDDMRVQLGEQTRSKRLLKKRQFSTLDVSREDEGTLKSPRLDTPGSCLDKASKHTTILAEAKALTNDSLRDRWLEKLLQAVEYVCSPADNPQEENKGVDEINKPNGNKSSKEERTKLNSSLTWPDSAVSAVVALEKASHEALSSDHTKYNQKLRSLWFNLKNTGPLAQRLLNGELEPLKILSMQPNELKEGLTQEEITRNQPEESAKLQMTDARCNRCNEKKVGLVDIIQAGHGDRYQLECVACGNTWYASRDEAAMLTIEGPSVTTNVGTAPWATTKFESVDKKKALSPRDTDKADAAKFGNVEKKKAHSPRDTERADAAKFGNVEKKKVINPRDTERTEAAKFGNVEKKKVLSPRDTERTEATTFGNVEKKNVLSPRDTERTEAAKFGNVEKKKVLSPRDTEKADAAKLGNVEKKSVPSPRDTGKADAAKKRPEVTL